MDIANGLGKIKRSKNPPLTVNLRRGSSIESIHKVHATVCDSKGRVLMCAGSSDYETYILSLIHI